jgi:hypothetical protein
MATKKKVAKKKASKVTRKQIEARLPRFEEYEEEYEEDEDEESSGRSIKKCAALLETIPEPERSMLLKLSNDLAQTLRAALFVAWEHGTQSAYTMITQKILEDMETDGEA